MQIIIKSPGRHVLRTMSNTSGGQGEPADRSPKHFPNHIQSSSSSGFRPLAVRRGVLKRPHGYQPELVALVEWESPTQADAVRSMTMNTAYGLMAVGSEAGVAIIDIVQHKCILALATPDLYGGRSGNYKRGMCSGAFDPFNRVPKAEQQPPMSSGAAAQISTGSERGESVDESNVTDRALEQVDEWDELHTRLRESP